MIKMLNHAKRGDPIEVMGLMTGKIAKGKDSIHDEECSTFWMPTHCQLRGQKQE